MIPEGAATALRAVLAVLHEPRFVDLAPAEVYATLLDTGQYLCSERTMYRVLAAHQEVRERRQQLRHPRYAAPELLARRPNELWSWDITKLLGPAKWTIKGREAAATPAERQAFAACLARHGYYKGYYH